MRCGWKRGASLVLVLCVVLLASACGGPAKGDEGGKGQVALKGADAAAVVVINGETVTRGQYEDALYDRFAEDHLERFIENRLLETKAAEMGVTPDEAKIASEVDKNVDTLLKTRFGGNEDAMRMALLERGMSIEGWRKDLTQKARRDHLIDAMVKKARDADADSVKKRFEQDYGEDGRKYRVRHILISTKVINSRFYTKDEYEKDKDQIEQDLKEVGGELLQKLQKGEDFAKLAREYSDDYTANRGGDLGEAWKGRFGKLFDEAVGGLKVGETSALIRAKRGYHILEVTKVNPGVEYRGSAILLSTGPTGPEDKRSAEDRDADAKKRAAEVKAALSGGKSFAEVAKSMSDDVATKARGGELGLFGRRRLGNEVDVVLEDAKAGTVTEPVKTPRGYWIVKLDARRAVPEKDRRVVRHIFLSAEYDDVKKRRLSDTLDEKAKAKAEALKLKVEGGEDFKELAINNTEDAYTRKAGGEYYNYRRTSLGPEVWGAVEAMKPGEETRLVKSSRGYHIVQVIEKQETKYEDVKAELLKKINEQPVSPADARSFLDGLKESAKIDRKIGKVPPARSSTPKGGAKEAAPADKPVKKEGASK